MLPLSGSRGKKFSQNAGKELNIGMFDILGLARAVSAVKGIENASQSTWKSLNIIQGKQKQNTEMSSVSRLSLVEKMTVAWRDSLPSLFLILR